MKKYFFDVCRVDTEVLLEKTTDNVTEKVTQCSEGLGSEKRDVTKEEHDALFTQVNSQMIHGFGSRILVRGFRP